MDSSYFKFCYGVVLLGCAVMLYGAVTIYKSEGRTFLNGCLIAAIGILLAIPAAAV